MSKILEGWKGIFCESGKFVPADEGFSYVCARVGITAFDHDAPIAAEFAEMVVDWFFSGNWIEVYEEEFE